MGWFFADAINVQNTAQEAREALKYFHNQSVRYSDYPARSIDHLIDLIGGTAAKSEIFTDTFGSIILDIKKDGFLNSSKVQDSMEALADRAQGKIPSQTSFFSSIGKSASDVSFSESVIATAKGTAAEIGTGAVALGDSVIAGAKSLNMILPIVMVAVPLFLIYTYTKRAASL